MMFLGVPLSYCRRIGVVNRLEGVNTVRWRAFLAGLISEWRDCNLLVFIFIARCFEVSHASRQGTVLIAFVISLRSLAQ